MIKVKKKISKKKLYRNKNKFRMTVFRSNTGLYVQVIDDSKNVTLASSSTKSLGLKLNNLKSAEVLAESLSHILKQKNITDFYFDRNKFPFKGRIKRLVDSLREFGFKF